jgi:membrane protein
MFQIISVLLTLILLFAYLKYIEKAKKKYSGSIVFEIIDREYSDWYKKKRNGIVINKKTASMFEVDKVVFKLKEKFEEQGVSKEQLKDYLDFLHIDEPKKVGFYSIIISVFGYFGFDKFIKGFFPQLNNITDISKVFNDIADTFNKNSNFVLVVLYLLFFIGIIALSIYISYKLATIDNLYIETQKIYVLKRVEKIWDFQINDSVYTTTDAKKEFEFRNNLIFPKLKDSKSKFEEDFERSIGDTFDINNEYFKDLPLIKNIKWQGIKEWLLGMSLPLFLIIIIFLMCYFMLLQDYQIHWTLITLFYILTLCVVYLFMLIYLTQIDKQTKLNVTKPENVVDSGQAELGSQTEASHSENLDSEEVKLEIKRRTSDNNLIYFSSAITFIINFILFCILVGTSKNTNFNLWMLTDFLSLSVPLALKESILLFVILIPIRINMIVIILSTIFRIERVNKSETE